MVFMSRPAFLMRELKIFHVSFTYNIFFSFSPEWAFIPAMWLTWKIFNSRIKNAVRLMKTIYLDKKTRWGSFLSRPPVAAAAMGIILVLLFAPLWRDSVEGRFILEPRTVAELRAEVPGTVQAID